MTCPAVVRVVVPSGPTVVRVVTPGPPGASSSGGANLSDDDPLPLATVATPGDSEEASRANHRHVLPSAQQVGADPIGTAAAAVAGHLAAVSHITLQQAAAAAPVQSVALSLPTGWSTQATSTGGNVILSLGLPTGQTLLTAADKTAWDAAAVLAGTAVQPAALATGLAGKADAIHGHAISAVTGLQAALDGKVGTSDSRLSDSRTPTAHKSSHAVGGSDALNAADVGADPQGSASGAITAHLAEASHLTQAQVRGSLSATLPITYSSSTGVIGANTDDTILLIFGEDSTALTVSTLRTIIWPEPAQLYAIPLWNVFTAPTGAACQFDIRVGGTSIFSTLPTIAAGGTLSSATTPAVFSAAFVTASQIIAQGASVSFHCTQIGTGSGTAVGAGLKVALYVRQVYS